MDDFLSKNKSNIAKLGKCVEEYLAKEKIFIPNPERFIQVTEAKKAAERLFKNFSIEVTNDPLQTGALVITIKGDYIECSSEREIKDFTVLIKNCNNFEIVPTSEGFQFNLMYYGALKRL